MVGSGISPRRHALPRTERLQKSAEYHAIFQQGRSFHGSLLVLFLLHEPGRRRRVGFVAGRRVGAAVRRNRAKRMLREGWRVVKADLPRDGFSAVLVARRGCEAAALSAVREELSRLVNRALGSSAGAQPDPGASAVES